ncbi:MAG: diguanylate cyclase [Pseudomonadota bacterium]
MFQLTAWSIPTLITTLLAIWAYTRLPQESNVPGALALRFCFAAIVFWSGAQTVGTVFTELEPKFLINKLIYIGITLVPVAWTIFALTYSLRITRLPMWAVNSLCIVPALTMIIAFTNEFHQLMWTQWQLTEAAGHIALLAKHGLWFYVHASYSYILIVVSTAILTFALAQEKQRSRTLVAAVVAPLCVGATNLFYLSPSYPLPWFDITALGFVIAIGILNKGVLQTGILKISPVMRERIVEQLKDPVMVVDPKGRIIDANQSALDAWDNEEKLLYSNISELVINMPLETLRDQNANTEVTIDEQAFEIATTSLDQRNPNANMALVFRDVTARRLADRELRNLKDELERMAHTDALTNMFNRRFFMQRLGEEFERVRRHGSHLSVLIFDLDHFKRVNDTYGHDVGDAVLVAVAEVVAKYKRITDVACRLGGEEFALLLPETGRKGAVNLANRIRQGVAGYDFSKACSGKLDITVSIGVATVSQSTGTPESFLKIADRALYKAKNDGRNLVCVDSQLS